MVKFRPNLGQFWPKRAIFEFSQKMRKRLFFRLQRLGLVQQARGAGSLGNLGTEGQTTKQN